MRRYVEGNFQKPFAPEFRRDAVELYRRSGKPLRPIAVDLGVSTETLRIWVRQAQVDEGKRRGLSSEERDELRALRREVRVLREERKILKKAAAFFAKQSNGR
jgi:transposase